MKPHLSNLLLALALTGGAAAQTPTNFQYGATFGASGYNAQLLPFSFTTEKSLELSAYDGSLLLYSSQEGLVRGNFDGGVVTYGNPVDIVLGSDESSQIDRGVFRIWGSSDYLYGTSSAKPLFSIDHPSGDAKFEGLDVTISNGTLSVGGSQVLTQATAPTFLGSFSGAIDFGNGSTGSSTAVAIGQNSPWAGSNGAVAMGGGAAYGEFSFASGQSTVALGKYTVAMGNGARAEGWYASAFGNSHAIGGLSLAASQGGTTINGVGATALSGGTADGTNTFAAGGGVVVKSYSAAAVGPFPTLPGASENRTTWAALDPAFTVGNGWWVADGFSGRSNAMQTLKNGQTTLKNKKWNSSTPLADPDTADSTDANGDALIVAGHTRLKGKVLIAPQGDLSMGGFTGGEAP